MTDDPSRLEQLVDPETAPLLYHTARNMQARQLWGIADRTLRHAVVPRLPVDFDARYERRVPADLSVDPDPIRANAASLRRSLAPSTRRGHRDRLAALAEGSVTFIGRTLQVEGADGVVWTGRPVSDPPPLWALKFHGFAFLRWATLGGADPGEVPAARATVREWVADWDHAPETRIGTPSYLRGPWTPHAVSLRLINWPRYYAWCGLGDGANGGADGANGGVDGSRALAVRLRRLTHKNAQFLANHVEHDVGGNHLVENGAGFVVAGVFLDEERFVRQGVGVLADAAAQFLGDGGHFERSPMYHVLTLTRYLTALDLLGRTDREIPPPLRRVAADGTRFLRAIRAPDGSLPLLNDSVAGEALSPRACLAYARRVGVDPPVGDGDSPRLPADAGTGPRTRAPAASVTADGGADADRITPAAPDTSGYHWLDTEAGRLLVDGAAVGPPHLPAHSHNDHLAVCLWVDGHPVATDTGTPAYAQTADRQYARSVAAHNTVQYGDCEPIDLGGAYLMGRRIEATADTASVDGVDVFDGRYRRGDGGYAHRRRVFAADDWWLVRDDVAASGDPRDDSDPKPIRSRLHLDPAVTVADSGDCGRFDLSHEAADATPLVSLYPLGARETTVETSRRFPRFGAEETRPSVSLRAGRDDPSVAYLLSTRQYDSVDVSAPGRDDDGTALTVTLDGDTRRLPDL